MFRKSIGLLLIVFLVVFLTPSFALASSPVSVTINEVPLSFDVPPTIIKGRTLVPLRAIFEALGASVNWDGGTRTITATKGQQTIVLTIDSKEAFNNQQRIELDVPATIIDGRTLVPTRFIAESLGAVVNWDNATRTVKIAKEGIDPLPKPEPVVKYIYSGMHLVNSDIDPGRYKSLGGVGYWERLSGLSGEFGDIIANGLSRAGPVIVDIKKSDVAFNFTGSGSFFKIDANYQGEQKSSFGDGFYLVGIDIEPGIYRSETGAAYWARLSGFGGELGYIIANAAAITGQTFVEIKPTDVGFETTGAQWIKVE